MQANPWKGEVSLVLDGHAYVLRPTFEALFRIEQELGTGFIGLARRLAEGTLTVDALACIASHCLTEKEMSVPDLREALIRSGLQHAMKQISAMMVMVLQGFHEQE